MTISLTLRIIIDVLIGIGAIFALAGVIGIMRMPDPFCRMQASTCITTMGVLGVCIGALLYAIFGLHSPATAVKVCVIAALIFTTNPVGAHALAKGAYLHGIRPDKRMEVDEMREDFGDE